jgi:hypothetical protein
MLRFEPRLTFLKGGFNDFWNLTNQNHTLRREDSKTPRHRGLKLVVFWSVGGKEILSAWADAFALLHPWV